MKKLLMLLPLLLLLGCDPNDVSRVRELNADLAAGLNRATVTVISLTSQGTLTTDEQRAILPKLSDATILSDQITGCTTAINAKETLQGCVTPLLRAVKDDVSAASLGVKSEGARATMTAMLGALLGIVETIGGIQ